MSGTGFWQIGLYLPLIDHVFPPVPVRQWDRIGFADFSGDDDAIIRQSMTFVEAMRILAAFERHDVAYVLVGSMALAAQGIVRATRDIDVFVDPDESNVRRLKAALTEVFDDPSIDEISSVDLGGDYPAISTCRRAGTIRSIFWLGLGDAFRYADLESEIIYVEGVPVRVATPRMLYRMKKDTVRAQDRLDAQVIKERFGLEGN